MHVLLTGVAGFIGFHVTKKLLSMGCRVTGVDSFNAYYNPALKEARVAQLQGQPGFTLKRLSLEDTGAVMELFKAGDFTHVLNLAAQAGVRYSLENPHAYVQSNLVGFVNLLEAARANPVERFVYASSSSVYGGNTKLPFSETDPVNTPISLYAATKRSNELIAHTYSHLFGMSTVGLRFFTVYGPWGRPDMMMWLFSKAIRLGEPIQVFNGGQMWRDFTFVEDIVQGVVKSLETPGLERFEVFNLGNHRSECLEDVIGLIEDALGKKAIRQNHPIPPGDVPRTYADIEHARSFLGFEPTTPVSEGVGQFVRWYVAEGHQFD